MPTFEYLRTEERLALVGYLLHLAGATATPAPIREPRLRIGELVVRGTCHVCHPAPACPRCSI